MNFRIPRKLYRSEIRKYFDDNASQTLHNLWATNDIKFVTAQNGRIYEAEYVYDNRKSPGIDFIRLS